MGKGLEVMAQAWEDELSTSETSGACIRNTGKGPKTDCPSH